MQLINEKIREFKNYYYFSLNYFFSIANFYA